MLSYIHRSLYIYMYKSIYNEQLAGVQHCTVNDFTQLLWSRRSNFGRKVGHTIYRLRSYMGYLQPCSHAIAGGIKSGVLGLYVDYTSAQQVCACMCERSSDRVYEWCHLSVFLSVAAFGSDRERRRNRCCTHGALIQSVTFAKA